MSNKLISLESNDFPVQNQRDSQTFWIFGYQIVHKVKYLFFKSLILGLLSLINFPIEF